MGRPAPRPAGADPVPPLALCPRVTSRDSHGTPPPPPATAAEAGRAGQDLDAVAEIAQKHAATASAFFYVDTLEFLRRGGRIGSARALLGSALAMKPILHVADGRVEPLEKVRTSAKAIARL